MYAPILLGLLGVGAAVTGYAVLVERRWYALRRYRLDILETGALDVLHLSDLHMVQGDDRMRRFLSSLPSTDVAVVTGDMLGDPDAVEYVVDSLRPVRGRRASYFVLGSNDVFAPRPVNYLRYLVPRERRKRRVLGTRGRAADLARLLEADGWIHLQNRKHHPSLDGVDAEVLGLDDPHIHRSDLSVAPRTAPERFGLAVVHSPDPAPELVALGYDLVVAGHTHGGQVRLPWFGALTTNSSVPRSMARGVIRMGGGHLHVSAGLGTNKFAPFRLFCRPESTLLELRSGGRIAASTDEPDNARTRPPAQGGWREDQDGSG